MELFYRISKVKLATIVEGNPKDPFSIATTPRCRGGRYSFPGLLYFTLDPYLIMLSVKQGGIKYHFLSLWYDLTWDWTQVSRTIGEHSNRWDKFLLFMAKFWVLGFSWQNFWVLYIKILNHKIEFYAIFISRQWHRRPGFSPRSHHTKDLKMVLDTSLLSTQHYKVCIKSKVEQSRGRSGALPYTSLWQLLKREPLGRPWLRSPTSLYSTMI